MTDSDVNYQFSGYQLPMIQLDETGPSYIVIAEPHPYYRRQPAYWSKPAYGGLSSNRGVIGNDIEIESNGNVDSMASSKPQTGSDFNLIPLD
jgi:hypothetical protein